MSSSDTPNPNEDGPGIRIGRYLLHRQIARGGMATIHIARLMGDEGFSRIVAAKRLLPEFVEDQDFLTMFLDEARVASKVHHRNVVPVLDVVTAGEEVILVQEYVHGAPLNKLLGIANKSKEHVPVPIAVSLMSQVLAGLQAAHDTTDEIGMPLNIVHRDVSPQNIMVSVDGTARLLDFGVAKATMAAHVTRENAFKGKIAYSAPEQLHGAATRQSDVYSLSIVLWELVVGHRMHNKAQAEMEIIAKIIAGDLPSICEALADEKELIAPERWAQIEKVDAIVKKGLAIAVHERWPSAAAMEEALVAAVQPSTSMVVAAWLKTLGRELLDKNDRMLAAEEASWRRTTIPGGRLTPLPGEVRRGSAARLSLSSSQDEISITPSGVRTKTEKGRTSPTAAAEPDPTVYAQPPERKKPIVLFALLGAILLALIIVIIVVTTGGSRPLPTASLPPPGPAPGPTATPTPTAAPAPIPTPVLPPTIPSAATGSNAVADTVETPVTPAPTIHTGTAAVTPNLRTIRQPNRPVIVRPRVVTPSPTTVVPPPAVKNCDPPFYFDGPKKVFKPECL